MFKLIVLSAVLAVTGAAPGLLSSTTILEPVGSIVRSIPTAVSHSSQTQVHSSSIVTPVVSPVIRTVAAPSIIQSVVPILTTAPASTIVKNAPQILTSAPASAVIKNTFPVLAAAPTSVLGSTSILSAAPTSILGSASLVNAGAPILRSADLGLGLGLGLKIK